MVQKSNKFSKTFKKKPQKTKKTLGVKRKISKKTSQDKES